MALDLYSKGTTDTLLAAKLDIAGGTMTGGLTLSASGIIFSDATYLTTAPAGSTLAADQLTAGVVAANPTAGPTTAGDVLQYDGAVLIWTPGAGGSFLPLAGGAMDADAEVTLSDTSNHDSELAGWGLGVQLTNDHAQGTTVEYNGLNTYDSSGNLHINPTGITFPDATVQTTAGYPNTNPSGFLTDAPSDGFAYNRKDGAWEVAGSGGSVAWGAISGTLSDQTDLNTALTTLQTNVDAKQNKSTLVTVSTSSDYYATSASENGVIYLDPSSSGIVTVYIPDGYSGTEFANGCSVTVINRSGGMSPISVQAYGGAFAHIIYGTSSIINGTSMTFYKIDGNDWFGQA